MGRPYTEIRRVTRFHEDLPVHIILQTRHCVKPVDFYCLSWRTAPPTRKSPNRQHYYDRKHGTGFWTIPVSVAVALLNEAHSDGMLDEEYDDLQERHCGTDNCITDSRDLGRRERDRKFASIINVNRDPDRDPGWGSDPLFVIIQVPDGKWRKIMIVDTDREICTFRSTTTSGSYGRPIVDGMTLPWRLDNAMQDASAAMMREFRRVLLEIRSG